MHRKFLIVVLLIMGFALISHAQENNYSSPEEPFVKQAISELAAAMSPPKGNLYLFGIEKKISGSFTFDLTIRGKGEMATVFVVSTEGGTIKMQNMLKDRLKAFRFSFKMPKGKSYKFQHTLQFN
jgi:hypothetical protein